MSKEDVVESLIKGSHRTVKDFARAIDLPYTTLLGMLKRGLGTASVDNIIKVCKGLGITVEQLLSTEILSASIVPFYVNEHEKLLVVGYRCKPEMRAAVDVLLCVDKDT